MVSRQLNCSGLFDVVRLRKEGYPYRLSHRDFNRRFYPLLRSQLRSPGAANQASTGALTGNETPAARSKAIISSLVWRYPGLENECLVGKSKVLVRELPYMWLERYLDVVRDRASRLVQRTARGKRGRSRAAKLKSSRDMLRAAISAGDLGGTGDATGGQKTGNPCEMGMLLREAGTIENMVSQSRAKRQLKDLVKTPVGELWPQYKLLQSLVAEAQVGGLDESKSSSDDAAIVAKGLELIAASKLLEEAVAQLDSAIVSGDPESLQDAISRAQKLGREYGSFCLSTVVAAKEMLVKCRGGPGKGNENGNARTLRRGLSRKALVDPASGTARRMRVREQEEARAKEEAEHLAATRDGALSALMRLTEAATQYGKAGGVSKDSLFRNLLTWCRLLRGSLIAAEPRPAAELLGTQEISGRIFYSKAFSEEQIYRAREKRGEQQHHAGCIESEEKKNFGKK